MANRHHLIQKQGSRFRRDGLIWRQDRNFSVQKNILFDSGCEGGNWVSAAIVRELEADRFSLPEAQIFVAFNGQDKTTKGRIILSFQVEDSKFLNVPFLISDDDGPFDMVVGSEDCLSLGILPEPIFGQKMPEPKFVGGLVMKKPTKGNSRQS